VEIRYGERVEKIAAEDPGHFAIQTSQGSYRARCVLLAIGRRGTPRKLGVPGEEQDKVVYRLVDPEQYRGLRVLVVGGGDSALEAACSLAELGNVEATLSYRREGFDRAKAKNRSRVERLREQGALQVWLDTEVAEIGPGEVRLRAPEGARTLGNDAVIVCAGGILPTALLESIGVRIETHHGEVVR
jgi:thioredoxin reductase